MKDVPGDTGEVGATLAKLVMQRTELNRLDDAYLALMVRFEEAMRALGVGLRISTEVSAPTFEGEGAELLTFDKAGGSWRLLFESGPDGGDPEQWSVTPLASCDRELRFRMFAEGHIAKLFQRAVAVLERAVAARTAHLAPSTALIDAISQTGPARSPKSGKP